MHVGCRDGAESLAAHGGRASRPNSGLVAMILAPTTSTVSCSSNVQSFFRACSLWISMSSGCCSSMRVIDVVCAAQRVQELVEFSLHGLSARCSAAISAMS